MITEDLALIPTHDLIAELVHRQTFAGMILYSPEEHKFDGQVHDHFNLLTTTSEEDTIRLLENTAAAMKVGNE